MDTKTEEETTVSSSEPPNVLSEEEEQMINTKSENGDNNEEEKSKSDNEQIDDPQPPLEQSVILEGKRSRKPTLRLEISEPVSTRKDLPIPQVIFTLSNKQKNIFFFYS